MPEGPLARIAVTIITGMSGSGKTSASQSFEDAGSYVVDNLPPTLIPVFLDLCSSSGRDLERVALVIDVRERTFLADFPRIYQELAGRVRSLQVLFLEAQDDVLLRRFSESRRPHPLGTSETLAETLQEERRLLEPIRNLAAEVIDTSTLNVHELRRMVMERYLDPGRQRGLHLSLISFGYKFGLPLEADLVFDVRFLPNPYFEAGLREKTGVDLEVQRFLAGQPEYQEFHRRLTDMLTFLLPRYLEEGKNYLTLAVGCTGGRHRSVAVAIALERFLRDAHYRVTVKHRDRKLSA